MFDVCLFVRGLGYNRYTISFRLHPELQMKGVPLWVKKSVYHPFVLSNVCILHRLAIASGLMTVLTLKQPGLR